MDAPATVHGLDYPAHFVNSLPVLRPRPEPHPPIRALTTSQFSDLHFAHLTSHAPDHVLFPFLHGLEGENEQQNAFFASARPKGDVPRFRGLVWVACDEDEDDVCDVDDFDEEDDDDYSSNSSLDSFGPTDLDEDVPMELDPTVEGPVVNGCPPPKPLDKLPVSPPPVPITAGQLPSNSNASTHTKPSFLTSSFRPRELLRTRTDERGSAHVFVDPKIPDGISLRNFGIQVPIYATISDIVVYSPRGITRSATAVADKFKQAVELKYEERRSRAPNPDALVLYNVFVLDASASEMATTLPHLVARTEDIAFSGAHTDGTDAHTNGESDDTSRLLRANTIDFAQREKDEMRDLTQASEIVSIVDPNSGIDLAALAGSSTATHWEPLAGQIFLGNSNDVPLPPDRRIRMRTLRGDEENDEDTFDWRTNDPGQGYGYDVCIECHDYAPFPTSAHLRAAEEHLRVLEKRWVERCVAEKEHVNSTDPLPPRPPPSASHVVHLPFPSSPASSVVTVNTLLPFIAFLETLLQPFADVPLTFGTASEQLSPSRAQNPYEVHSRRNTSAGFTPSSLPPPSSFPTSFFPSSPSSTSAYTRVRSTSATYLPASSPSTPVSTSPISSNPVPLRTRPVKILIYSADGYTESSVLALCILMAIRGISLPEAYLTLQVEKRRSFFVYQSDLGVLRRVEARLEKDRTAKNQDQSSAAGTTSSSSSQPHPSSQGEGHGDPEVPSPQGWVRSLGRASAKSVSFAAPPALDKSADPATGVSAPATVHPMWTRSESEADAGTQSPTPGRPRAHTMPPTRVPPWKDHQAWFDDPRFDGSFPSRVLPFLYLGNLNHASNVFMLHALGITHVVSVGECALVPPPHIDSASAGAISCSPPNPGAHFVQGKGPGGQGSLWIEEREGRIKVLDIKGVCDDGIDTLEPQLQPVCDWIDKAREEGGKVLVHCRVGVSRSATVTIAYVMKHLSLPLVDAYLIVRSRRLSVLIQPNMRLLYNLLGWEAKLARERTEAALPEEKLAGLSDEEKQVKRRTRLQGELARALNWPYLAKEVHALNEKYLH